MGGPGGGAAKDEKKKSGATGEEDNKGGGVAGGGGETTTKTWGRNKIQTSGKRKITLLFRNGASHLWHLLFFSSRRADSAMAPGIRIRRFSFLRPVRSLNPFPPVFCPRLGEVSSRPALSLCQGPRPPRRAL